MWYNLNGNIEQDPLISVANRSFRYGDGLFESMRIFNGKLFNKSAHQERLSFSMEVLQLTLAISLDALFKEIEGLAQNNQLSSAAARLTLFRNEGGKYTPLTNNASFLIEVAPADADFQLNKKGLDVGVYATHRKALGKLSNIKSNNALLYVLASNYKQVQGLDDVLLLNDKGNLVEGSSSNLFALKAGRLLTPPLTEGPLDGTMRAWIMQHYEVEEQSLSMRDLEEATEVFLTNAHGIRWIQKIGANTYEKKWVEELLIQLNLEKDRQAY